MTIKLTRSVAALVIFCLRFHIQGSNYAKPSDCLRDAEALGL